MSFRRAKRRPMSSISRSKREVHASGYGSIDVSTRREDYEIARREIVACAGTYVENRLMSGSS